VDKTVQKVWSKLPRAVQAGFLAHWSAFVQGYGAKPFFL